MFVFSDFVLYFFVIFEFYFCLVIVILILYICFSFEYLINFKENGLVMKNDYFCYVYIFSY